jgi:D-apionolactonase
MLTSAYLLAGTPVVPPTPMPLKRGSLSVEFEDGLLRNIRLGDTLILQRIYCAVRDHNWGTIPGVVRIISQELTDTDITIVFECTHQQNDIDFAWTGTIHLTDTEVSFDMDGVARSSFRRNRIGFCVLHDADLAGQPCVIEHIDGLRTEGVFPEDIAPNQPYFNIRAIQHAVDADTTVTVLMEGDTFEMEDQRNWSDASYKTYCTSLAQPIPMLIEAGTRIHQCVTLSIVGNATIAEAEQKIVISRLPSETVLPALGPARTGSSPSTHRSRTRP